MAHSIRMMAAICAISGLGLMTRAEAGEWMHDEAAMNQFGGFVGSDDGAIELSYGCALSSGITLHIKGRHSLMGLAVDGQALPPPDLTDYFAQQDATVFGYQVAPDASSAAKRAFNVVLATVAAGKVLDIRTDAGAVSLPIAGGQKMTRCEMWD